MINEDERVAIRGEMDRALQYLVHELGLNPAAVLAIAHAAVILTIAATFGQRAAADSIVRAGEMLDGMVIPAPEVAQFAGRPN